MTRDLGLANSNGEPRCPRRLPCPDQVAIQHEVLDQTFMFVLLSEVGAWDCTLVFWLETLYLPDVCVGFILFPFPRNQQEMDLSYVFPA